MTNHSKIIYNFVAIFIVALSFFNWSILNQPFIVHAETITQDTPITTSTPQLLDRPIFRENEKSSVVVYPHFKDGSTNVAFYIDIDGTMWWQAEQLGSYGDVPFSIYWDPTPAIGKYVAIEYFNDAQQFSCSGLSLNECIADSHFISQESFEIVDNNAIIPVPTPPTIDIIDNGVTPLAPLPDSAPVDSTSTPTSTPEPVIQENADGSTTLIAI